MNSSCAQSRTRAVAFLVTLLAGVFLVPACRRGADPAPTNRPPPVWPFPGFFQTRVGDDVYLFATLAEKSAFHSGSPDGPGFDVFMSRNGQRVLISNADPSLVPRIRLAFEQALGTELAAFEPVPLPDSRPSTAPAPP